MKKIFILPLITLVSLSHAKIDNYPHVFGDQNSYRKEGGYILAAVLSIDGCTKFSHAVSQKSRLGAVAGTAVMSAGIFTGTLVTINSDRKPGSFAAYFSDKYTIACTKASKALDILVG